MTLRVNDLLVEGTVNEIIDFIDKYDHSPYRYQLGGVIWNSDGTPYTGPLMDSPKSDKNGDK